MPAWAGPATLGALKSARARGDYARRSGRDEVRDNLIVKLRRGDRLFPGVVGYDDTHIARLRHIWLTSVDNANREVGRRAGERLGAPLPGPRPPGNPDLSQPRLHHPGTTPPPP